MTYLAAEERYSTMPYRRTGRSGLTLPALSLGLWHNFGHARAIETQADVLRRAFDRGITHFDLANNYGPPPGSAETNFGRVFAENFRPYRDELIVSTKAGYEMWAGPYGEWGSRKNMLSSLDASLGRMGLDYVDIFYSHRPDPETPIEETMGALATAVQQGKALYVGISNYDPAQTRAAYAALAEYRVPLLIHQPRYSMFDRTSEDGLFPALEELGMGSIAFSPLAQGLLTDRYLDGTVPIGSRIATSHFLDESALSEVYLTRARALNDIAAGRGQTLAQLAITWILRQPTVTSVLVGASSVAQLEQNIAALDSPALTAAEIAAIEPFAVNGTSVD
ncbi:aldo/keto reductase [Glaciibacter psychrotolerans]|uniref:L-glyceraldehyde 3-phosphate reductase n=1 Tax=Glaciibacter psychrotolerans TaxID=670054 RepID=A0A7Z0J5B5_9MICO|nr:aldo/keto reductase [Leifsonia psychrotolerans]NYJ19220.1 L-glyceraldehyde 3-phosphate reductase [Leifsonia psychrotolerans]